MTLLVAVRDPLRADALVVHGVCGTASTIRPLVPQFRVQQPLVTSTTYISPHPHTTIPAVCENGEEGLNKAAAQGLTPPLVRSHTALVPNRVRSPHLDTTVTSGGKDGNVLIW